MTSFILFPVNSSNNLFSLNIFNLFFPMLPAIILLFSIITVKIDIFSILSLFSGIVFHNFFTASFKNLFIFSTEILSFFKYSSTIFSTAILARFFFKLSTFDIHHKPLFLLGRKAEKVFFSAIFSYSSKKKVVYLFPISTIFSSCFLFLPPELPPFFTGFFLYFL